MWVSNKAWSMLSDHEGNACGRGSGSVKAAPVDHHPRSTTAECAVAMWLPPGQAVGGVGERERPRKNGARVGACP